MVAWIPVFGFAACGGGAPLPEGPAAPPPAAVAPPEWLLPRPAEPPDLVLTFTNGLRADLGGVPAAEAAFFAALGREPAVRYTHAFTASVAPHVATVSALTGRYPSAVPVCSWGQGAEAAPWCVEVPAAAPTLPEVLGLYGYATAFVAVGEPLREDPWLTPVFGATLPFSGPTARAEGLAAALDWWAAHAGTPRLLVLRDDLLPELREVAGASTPDGLEATTRHALTGRYGRSAATAGELVGSVLTATLEGGPRPAFAVVTSAHGLNVGETEGTPSLPQMPLHHDALLERTLHVPLAVFASAAPAAPLRVDTNVELIDLAPTFTHLGRAMPPAGLAGVDLLAGAHAPDRIVYAEYGDMLAVRDARHLLLARVWQHGGTTLDPQLTRRLVDATPGLSTFGLHDVEADPFQETDRLAAEPELGLTLYRKLLGVRQGAGAPPPDALTPERVEALRKTGAISYF